MLERLKKHWFMIGLIAVAGLTIADQYELSIAAGRWLKSHYGPSIVIFVIFFLSGLALDARMLRRGVGDWRATIVALIAIFIFAPLVAMMFGRLPLNIQIITGLYLVAAMPTTLSSGVVMTDAAGGNPAHALLVTIAASTIAVFTIPTVLVLLLGTAGDSREIVIDKVPMMIKIACLVLAPLACGMAARGMFAKQVATVAGKVKIINQLLILSIVWMAMCQSREVILSGGRAVVPIFAIVLVFHIILLAMTAALVWAVGIGPGRRESVLLMGAQKTLPLSVIVQVALFPEYGLALVVCVAHHIMHLIFDAYLVGRLRRAQQHGESQPDPASETVTQQQGDA